MKIKSGFIKQLSLAAISVMTILLTSGLARANDSTLSITPVIAHFPPTVLGLNSPSTTFRIKNHHISNTMSLDAPSITGPDASQFSIFTGSCGATLGPGQECTVDVRFQPSSNGSKMAKLEVGITSGAPDTAVLAAFLSNEEDSAKAAERRLPPVLFSLSIPETMTKGTSYDLDWSILGYHDSYESVIALFDCTSMDPGECGANFTDPERFADSGLLSGTGPTPQPAWKYNGETAVEHHFTYSFDTTLFPQTSTGTYQIVVRIYNRNNMDEMSLEPTISLMIPGNLTSEYYDGEGRRITKYINVP